MRLTPAHCVGLKHLAGISTVAVGLTLCIACSSAQTTTQKLDTPRYTPVRIPVDQAIAALNSGIYTFTDIDSIAEAPENKRQEAITILRTQFSRTEVPSDKGKIACALYRLGVKDDVYWNFLTAQATQAADDDAPFYFEPDKSGHFTDALSPKFRQWAADHHLSVAQAVENEDREGPILFLALTHDARAIPILRKALYSPDFVAVAFAAQGLASLHDKESAPFIIAACGRVPAEAAVGIALALVYFDDADAQKAVDLYVPKERAAEARQAQKDGFPPL